jgi:hypothetical protein
MSGEEVEKVAKMPFHALACLEGKLFKPRGLHHARALVWYAAPIVVTHLTRTICGVEETKLVLDAQILMLNSSGIIDYPKPLAKASRGFMPPSPRPGVKAKPPPLPSSAPPIIFQGYGQSDLALHKTRALHLISEFLRVPLTHRIPMTASFLNMYIREGGHGDVSMQESSTSESDMDDFALRELVPAAPPVGAVADELRDWSDEDWE